MTNEEIRREQYSLEALSWLYQYRILLGSLTVSGAIIAILISFFMKPMYHATAIIRPVEVAETESEDSHLSVAGAIGGLLGNNKADQSAVVLAYMTSTSFAKRFILEENLLPELYPEKWDTKKKTWKGAPPIMEDASKRFLNRMTVSDRRDGLWLLDVEWDSPQRALSIAQDIIARVNEARRDIALQKARKDLDYLYGRLERESIQEMRQTLANLASQQITKIMLAQAPTDFSIEVIDGPNASRWRVSPQRKLFALAGALLGFFGGVFYLLFRQNRRTSS